MSSLEVLDDMIPVTPNDEWKFSVMVKLHSPFNGIKQQNKELMLLMEKFGNPNSDYMFTNARMGDLFHIRFKDSKLAAWFKLHKIIK